MLTDRYGLTVTTASPAARDAYMHGCDLLQAFFPGPITLLDQAIEADPGFALAYAAKARAHQLYSDIPSARAAMATAQSLSKGLPEREASHIAFFGLILAGQSDAAFDALKTHLAKWPRDALVLSTCVSPSGLIGASGRDGQKREQCDLMDSLAQHYAGDWWFAGFHAFALAETGQCAAARPKIERSLQQNPNNAWGAHSYAHLCYEAGERDTARDFIRSWLPCYPGNGLMHGHLSWHLALVELEAGNAAEAFRLYIASIAPGVHNGPALTALNDAASFLWRSELAGHERDPALWRDTHDFAHRMFPRANIAFADWHVALTDAVTGDGASMEARLQQMADLVTSGRYPSGPVVPALLRAFTAFQRQDFNTVIDTIEPCIDHLERIGGSRAQTDLVEFTLLRAYLLAGRPDDASHLLRRHRAGPTHRPVAGLEALH